MSRKNEDRQVRVHEHDRRDPSSVRTRTGDGNEQRYYATEEAADFHDCTRSDAIARTCDAVPGVARAVREVLKRDDLTSQKQEIADTLSTRGLSFDVESAITGEKLD